MCIFSLGWVGYVICYRLVIYGAILIFLTLPIFAGLHVVSASSRRGEDYGIFETVLVSVWAFVIWQKNINFSCNSLFIKIFHWIKFRFGMTKFVGLLRTMCCFKMRVLLWASLQTFCLKKLTRAHLLLISLLLFVLFNSRALKEGNKGALL